MDDIQPKRRWYQFGLRTFFLGILVIAIGCGWFALKLQSARKQRTAVATIREWGGDVDYSTTPAPAWLSGYSARISFAQLQRCTWTRACPPATPNWRN